MSGRGESGGAEVPEREPEPGGWEGDAGEYRRRARPVRVRRSRGPDWGRIWRRGWKPALIGAAALGLGAGANAFFLHSAWFVLTGSDQIAVRGARYVAPARVTAVFAADLGRNVFFIPLGERQRAIEAIPWVASASVLRLWPARLEVQITERTPVAFARAGDGLVLLDASGVVLHPPAQSNFNFPVLAGVPGVAAAQPNTPAWLARRQPAMQEYGAFRAALGRHGGGWTGQVSEIDLSDPANVQARVVVPGAPGTTTLVEFGNAHFASRYALFLSQIGNWLRKYPNLASVDLRYDGEAIVDPGTAAPAVAVAQGAQPGARR